MPLYSDVLFRGFNNYGYNVLRRPTAGLAVFDLLGRDDVLERIGPLQALVTLSAPLPPVEGPVPSANFAGQLSSQMHITTGLAFLQAWLQALSGTASIGDLAAAFPSARFLEFVLDAPTNLHSDTFAIVRAINAVAVRPGSPAGRYAEDRNTDLFVVTEIMQMDGIGVRAYDIGSTLVPIDMPALAQAVGANVSLTQRGGLPNFVICQGRAPVTFAFRCLRVRRERGATPRFEIRLDDKDQGVVRFAPGTMVAVA